jgi:hypothetical protein
MPKIEGKPDTRKTIPLELALIASFEMPWEDRVAKRPCCIEGCTHRCSGFEPGVTLAQMREVEPCARNNAAVIYDERRMPGPVPDPVVGWACPHCVEKILDREDEPGA